MTVHSSQPKSLATGLCFPYQTRGLALVLTPARAAAVREYDDKALGMDIFSDGWCSSHCIGCDSLQSIERVSRNRCRFVRHDNPPCGAGSHRKGIRRNIRTRLRSDDEFQHTSQHCPNGSGFLPGQGRVKLRLLCRVEKKSIGTKTTRTV